MQPACQIAMYDKTGFIRRAELKRPLAPRNDRRARKPPQKSRSPGGRGIKIRLASPAGSGGPKGRNPRTETHLNGWAGWVYKISPAASAGSGRPRSGLQPEHADATLIVM